MARLLFADTDTELPVARAESEGSQVEESTARHVVLQNVSKRYGETLAVDDLSLTIQDGELLVLLGPSGCGKTTTLNLLAGLEEPTSGDIYFGKELVTRVPAERREISMVFQTIGLYPHLNVLDNITFAVRIRKTPKDVINSRVAEIVDVLGIGNFLHRRLIELSGGERQRVAIAKALIGRPYLFLLDEPFSSLDADRRRQLRADLVRIHGQLGTTMVFVTHDQEEAMSVADHIAVMRGGKLQQLGSPLEVHDKPTTLWVATFVGAHPMNVIPSFCDTSAPRAVLFAREGPQVKLDESLWKRIRESGVRDEFTLGIRPGLLRVAPGPGGEGDLVCEVVTRQVLGTEILYLLRAGQAELRAVVSSEAACEVGTKVIVRPRWDRVFVFDKETECCLVN